MQGVTLGIQRFFAGTPSTLGERAKLPFTYLIYKGTVTHSYESLPFSSVPFCFCFCFVFFLFLFCFVFLLFLQLFLCFFFLLCFCLLLLTHVFASSLACRFCFIFFVAAWCWLLLVLVGFVFFQVSYPFRMNVLFDSLLCIHLLLTHFWLIHCFVLNECVGLLLSEVHQWWKHIFFSKKKPYGFF